MHFPQRLCPDDPAR